MTVPQVLTIDIEPTNRCNASCYFCPRDQTPHQGLMSPAVFDQALARAIELRPLVEGPLERTLQVNLCGLGEPLLNRHTPDFVRKLTEAGFRCSLASNGALLDERRSAALLDAGLDEIDINIGEVDEQYEEIYKVPWQQTFERIVRFREMAGDRCKVTIVLVDHRDDPTHLESVTSFWRSAGFEHFHTFPLINRGGALERGGFRMPSASGLEQAHAMVVDQGGDAICSLPFVSMTIGYDGVYYLCCSDWKKEVPMGTVFDRSLVDILRRKLEMTLGRESICAMCSLDPLIRIAGTIEQSGDTNGVLGPRWVTSEIVKDSEELRSLLGRLDAGLLDVRPDPALATKARIPLRVR